MLLLLLHYCVSFKCERFLLVNYLKNTHTETALMSYCAMSPKKSSPIVMPQTFEAEINVYTETYCSTMATLLAYCGTKGTKEGPGTLTGI